MGAGQAQIFTKQLHQKGARIDVRSNGLTVYGKGNGRHERLLQFPKKRLVWPVGLRPPVMFQAKTRRFGRFFTLELELL
jgi:hypothetical protein